MTWFTIYSIDDNVTGLSATFCSEKEIASGLHKDGLWSFMRKLGKVYFKDASSLQAYLKMSSAFGDSSSSNPTVTIKVVDSMYGNINDKTGFVD